MPAAPGSSTPGDLCSGCGLCCQGWVSFQTLLSHAEAEGIRRVTAVVQTPLGPVIPQPCAFHTGCACRIYDRRPMVCRQFSCASLSACERGELSFDDAQQRIQRAVTAMTELGAELRAAGWMLPGDAGVTAWRRFTAESRRASDPVAFRRTNARVLLAGATASAAGVLALGDCL